MAWFPEYETLVVFSRRIDGREIEVSDIDVYGNTGDGKLKGHVIVNCGILNISVFLTTY